MDPLKPIHEYNIHIQDEKKQEEKITKEQEQILFHAHLANVLLFWAWTLTPEQRELQSKLYRAYLKNLKPWDIVEIWLEEQMIYYKWVITENDWQILKIKASCWCNKKKEEGIRSFSITNWYSKWFLFIQDDRPRNKKSYFYIVTPEKYTVESTRWMPQELMDEVYNLYQQAGDTKTCYGLVHALKSNDSD